MKQLLEYIVSWVDYNLGWVITFVVIVFLLSVVFGVEYWSEYSCESYERITGTPAVYNDWDTCYVEYEGVMRRWDEYKAIQREVKIK